MEPTEKDIQNLGARVGEVLAQKGYPTSGEISWEWHGGKWREWRVWMLLGDEWTGEDVDLVIHDKDSVWEC
jgi:hypothetical protein